MTSTQHRVSASSGSIDQGEPNAALRRIQETCAIALVYWETQLERIGVSSDSIKPNVAWLWKKYLPVASGFFTTEAAVSCMERHMEPSIQALLRPIFQGGCTLMLRQDESGESAEMQFDTCWLRGEHQSAFSSIEEACLDLLLDRLHKAICNASRDTITVANNVHNAMYSGKDLEFVYAVGGSTLRCVLKPALAPGSTKEALDICHLLKRDAGYSIVKIEATLTGDEGEDTPDYASYLSICSCLQTRDVSEVTFKGSKMFNLIVKSIEDILGKRLAQPA